MVVMTTEVLRNMLYEGSPTLDRLRARRHGRGPLPAGPLPRRRLGGGPDPPPALGRGGRLSATVSNAEEFGEWIGALRGPTRVVIEERRPVRWRTCTWSAASSTRCTSSGRAARSQPVPRLPRSERAPRPRTAGGRGGLQRETRGAAPGGPSALLRAAPRGGGRAPGRGRDAAGDLLRVQPGRLRPERRLRDGFRGAARPATRAADDRRGRRLPGRLGGRGGPHLARLLRFREALAAGVAAHHAGHAPAVQGDGRDAVRLGSRQGGLRHRDALARDQHAGEDRRHRGPVEVLGRAPRVADAGRVHAAHGPRRPEGHRRDRVRRRPVPAAGALRARGRAGVHPDLRAAVLVPPLVQHGREPRAELLARGGPPPAELLVRAVPGGPGGGDAGAAARTRQRVPRRLPRDGVRPGRLRRVLAAAGAGEADPR